MRKKQKILILIPIFIGILMVAGEFSLVSATDKSAQQTSYSSGDSVAVNQSAYLPLMVKQYHVPYTVESPFSIEIAALGQISVTNQLDPEAYIEQINAWYDQALVPLLARLKESGAGWTRIVINWSEIEPRPEDPYNIWALNRYDNRLNQISQTGVKIIAVINGAPAWASDTSICPAITDVHFAEFQQFLDFIVARYSQTPYNIHTWELFNEADNTSLERAGSHACFGNFGSVYAQVLNSSYGTIKTADPNATILMSGIAYEWWTEDPYNGPFYRYFPDDVMSAGGASFIDALNFHYFPDFHLEWERWGPPEVLPTCSIPPDVPGVTYDGSGIDVIAKKNHFSNRMNVCYGVDKPVYLTEMAEHGVITDTGSLRNQAFYVIKGYSRGLAAGIENITWYALAAPSYDPYDQSLLDENFNPKPAFNTYKILVSQLSNYEYLRTITSTTDVEAYVFGNPYGAEKIIAWGNNYLLPISPATLLVMTEYDGRMTPIIDGGMGDMDGIQNGSIQVSLILDPMGDSTIIKNPVPVPYFIQVISR